MTSNFSQMYIFPFLIDYLILNFLFASFLASPHNILTPHCFSWLTPSLSFLIFRTFSSFPSHSFQHILIDAATRDVNFKYDIILLLILFFDYFQFTYRFLILFLLHPSLNFLFICLLSILYSLNDNSFVVFHLVFLTIDSEIINL